ncbi:MAG: hypothetical protein KGJ60_02955 [Verrucomicrobiota bacterium]|nr:hypothetical protein [Verrucomicrobiota bacterium]
MTKVILMSYKLCPHEVEDLSAQSRRTPTGVQSKQAYAPRLTCGLQRSSAADSMTVETTAEEGGSGRWNQQNSTKKETGYEKELLLDTGYFGSGAGDARSGRFIQSNFSRHVVCVANQHQPDAALRHDGYRGTFIQPAVDGANDGDTVLVEPGQYDLTNRVTITKAITLRSAMGAGQTILNLELFLDRGLSVSNSAAVVDGFTVQPDYTYPWEPTGISLVGGTVQNCIFPNFLIGWTGTAVYMVSGVLSNSVVANYHRFGNGSGSAVYCSDGGLVTDCQVLGGGNAQPFGIGIYLVNSQSRNSLISGAPPGNAGGVALCGWRAARITPGRTGTANKGCQANPRTILGRSSQSTAVGS